MANTKKTNSGIKERPADISKVRSDSIDFDNRENGVAKILKVTKRKNSVRRQFVFAQTDEDDGQK